MTETRFDLTCSICQRRGDKGTYELPVACTNCGIKGVGVYSQGHEAKPDRCPNCGTSNLRVDHSRSS